MSKFLSFKKNVLKAVNEAEGISDEYRSELLEVIRNADVEDLVSLVRTGYTQHELGMLHEKWTDAYSRKKWKRDAKNLKAGLSFAKGAGRTAGEKATGKERVKQAKKSISGKKAVLAGTALVGAAAIGAGAYAAKKIMKKRAEKKEKKEIQAWKKRQGLSDSFTKNYIRRTFSELVGTRYVPLKAQGDEEYAGDEDEAVDFPYIEDPEPFITHRAMESLIKSFREQGEDPPPEGMQMPPEAGEGAEVAVPEGVPPEGVPPEGMVEEEELNADEIGRVYELKKIYSRMTSIESYLSGTSEQDLVDLRRYVAKAIDLFEVVITNFPQFKDRVDDIIVTYYKFVSEIYSMVRDHYKSLAGEKK